MHSTLPTWIERVRKTHYYHVGKVKENSSWTLKNTSQSLGRSLGSVCEDMLLASYLTTHYNQLIKFKYIKDALEFVRKNKQEMRLRELNL